jgi:hypothetical protein
MAATRWLGAVTAVGIPTALLLVLAQIVAAQTPQMTAGSRVRVHVVDRQPPVIAGVLLSATPDSLRLLSAHGRDTIAFASSSVARLDLHEGSRAHTGKGALVGAGVGVGLALVVGIAASGQDCSGSGFCTEPRPEDIGLGMLLLGGVGAGVGALVGAAFHTDRWVRASPPWLVMRVNPAGRSLGTGLKVSIAGRP